jgi:hypothetical protein
MKKEWVEEDMGHLRGERVKMLKIIATLYYI